MRIGTKLDDPFLVEVSEKNEKIQKLYLENIKKLTKHITIKTMLADSTVTEQETFDPKFIEEFYKKIIDQLLDWQSEGVMTSNNEDLRRIFVKFHVTEGNYILSCHMSLQFHVLLFYKPDKAVIRYQKELATIFDKIKQLDSTSEKQDQIILEKLRNEGYTDLDHQKLFEIFFNNDNIREKIYQELDRQTDNTFKDLNRQQQKILEKLDTFLIETYQTTPILIDEQRLTTGEEGCLCVLDLEFVTNKTRKGTINPKKISDHVKKNILQRLEQLVKVLGQ